MDPRLREDGGWWGNSTFAANLKAGIHFSLETSDLPAMTMVSSTATYLRKAFFLVLFECFAIQGNQWLDSVSTDRGCRKISAPPFAPPELQKPLSASFSPSGQKPVVSSLVAVNVLNQEDHTIVIHSYCREKHSQL